MPIVVQNESGADLIVIIDMNQVIEEDVSYLIMNTLGEDTISLRYPPLDARTIQSMSNDVMTAISTTRNVTIRYVCDYCGTEYNADTGFVPPCNNCGARLRRVG